MYPEQGGFWTVGRQVAVTLAVPAGRTAPLVLRIHSGGQANNATISSFGWHRQFALVPGQAAEVTLPVVAGGVIPLTISTDKSFSPQAIDPASGDARLLGIWVEIVDPVTQPS